jgi:hypothetical protein
MTNQETVTYLIGSLLFLQPFELEIRLSIKISSARLLSFASFPNLSSISTPERILHTVAPI